MKNIIYKELTLVISPGIFLFSLCAALLLIPNYPYSVGMSYILLGVFIALNLARANNDHLFTALLPVARRHIVAGKLAMVLILEAVQLLVAMPFAALSLYIVNTIGNPVGMDPNFAFFGITLIEYAVFNVMFLPLYFKTGYKTGIPMLCSIIGYGLTVTLFESVLSFVPALHNALDGTSANNLINRLAVLVLGLAIFAISAVLSYKIAVKNFRKVNL